VDRKTEKHILNVLRRGTISWRGRRECLVEGRVREIIGHTIKNRRPIYNYKYQCNKCEQWFREEDIEIDHIEEVGSFSGDFNDYIAKLYCAQDNLQKLCISCHSIKTIGNARLRYSRKEIVDESIYL
jgi:hypothetical protein